ncbi:MAG TPA: UDP-N-acetylglucosamine 4,6-dehydratase (inverting) [Gemmataceae bacterium]|nr:UDP-N-acetylglucosamine 4,6-dehydratase (inverting) [Gemmataceae bacterium]
MIDCIHDARFLDGKSILITGGTGSLGNMLVSLLLEHAAPRRIIIFSRDEYKQFLMAEKFRGAEESLRFFLGDVRDKDRLKRAFEGVDYVIHAAALKQVPAAEYNPFEFVKTNVLGAQNVIDTAIDAGIKRVAALSTDKAANPINLYGATKLCSDKLFVAGNSYSGQRDTRFAIVRYGNVVGSRGSVIPFFLERRKTGVLPITHAEMTRFWITLQQAAVFVLNALKAMHGGEIFVPKIPSMRIVDLARIIGPGCRQEIIGVRPGEKLHEMMVEPEAGHNTLDCGGHYVIQPVLSFWNKSLNGYAKMPHCPVGFAYTSGENDRWVGPDEMKHMILELNVPGTDDLREAWARNGRAAPATAGVR